MITTDRIMSLIAEVACNPNSCRDPEADPSELRLQEDIGLDDVDLMELAQALEVEHSIALTSTPEFERWITVHDVVRHVNTLLFGRPEAEEEEHHE